ncbi:MAG: FAD-binding protein, partial [Acidobacteria bacterium]|nr:FAD-binding protein [Acidobacteriota bacterium]NIO60368.1 FAD-binding protein [Acidobacteriota bacterium]NIT12041.1 FAD-binding protein [Acidobacteriota bacterium]
MRIPDIPRGTIPPDPVAPDALAGIPRQQSNPPRWQGTGWGPFRDALRSAGIELREGPVHGSLYVTDAGGMAHGMPTACLVARSAEQVATVLRAAQEHVVPVTTRGGGLTTEGESVAFGGLMLDMTGMSRVLAIDPGAMTVRTQAGIFWHELAENLRRRGLDYLSAPLNLTSSVGG